MDVLDDAGVEKVDEALRDWRQGDCVLGEHWFLFRTDTHRPLTPEAASASAEGIENVEVEVKGFMLVTQTCDLVRSCRGRPFVEVSPLVEVDEHIHREIERGRRPNYAFIAGLADEGLVADLDRVMTVEKSLVAGWARVPGCGRDEEARRLALALARKRARTAFPDDFVALATSLKERMSLKHDKGSDEGRALRALREIRVRAAPSWDADRVHVHYWFIRNDDQSSFENEGWEVYLKQWLARTPPSGRFFEVTGTVQGLDDLTARDYVESDPLDLDHLSSRDR